MQITREMKDRTYIYRDNGRRITRTREILRLNSLAVPPAWQNVEIARSAKAKVLARGVDSAGRTQAVYSPAYRRKQDRQKFDRVLRFAEKLPLLRAQIDRDLRRRTLTKDRVVACVIRLIDQECFRVGNTEYAKRYRSFGVTTLKQQHVRASTQELVFDFIGKSGKRHLRKVRDPRIIRLVGRLSELPGAELFCYLDDDGVARHVQSRHINAYVKRYMGEEFSAKDFRSWGGTMLAASQFLELDPAKLTTPAAKATATKRIVAQVAKKLGNTSVVTKNSYIDPRVFEAVLDDRALVRARKSRARKRPRRYLSVDEQCALELLR
jgi:DNA topoisomerase-1